MPTTLPEDDKLREFAQAMLTEVHALRAQIAANQPTPPDASDDAEMGDQTRLAAALTLAQANAAALAAATGPAVGPLRAGPSVPRVAPYEADNAQLPGNKSSSAEGAGPSG